MDHRNYLLALAREEEIRSMTRRPEQQALLHRRRRARRQGRTGR